MGDICDMHDVCRFLRSPEGKEHLGKIAESLRGKVIRDVRFTNEVSCVAITLDLDDGNVFEVFLPSLDIYVLREEFAKTLEREYFRDFPERLPS